MARDENAVIIRSALRFLYGPARRSGGRTPYRSHRARETALKHRPWERGRIGAIEQAVHRELVLHGDMLTGALARAVYIERWRAPGEPAPTLKPWMRDRIKIAARTFADPVARSRGPGRPWLWRLRSDQNYFHEVRKRKGERDTACREEIRSRTQQARNTALKSD